MSREIVTLGSDAGGAACETDVPIVKLRGVGSVKIKSFQSTN